MKRIVALLLCTLLLIPILPAAAETGEIEYPKTMTVWFKELFSDEVNENFVARCEEFGRLHGIDLRVTLMSVQDMASEFAANLEAGVLPDLAMTADYLVIHLYGDDMPFVDLTDVIQRIEKDNQREFMPSAISASSFGGGVYRTPFNYSTAMLYVRKDLMEKAGIDMPEEWTFDQVFQIAPSLSDPQNGVYGLAVGMGSNDNDGLEFLMSAILANGGGLFDDEGNPTACRPENIEVVQQYIDAWKAGAISPEALSANDAWNNQSYLMGTQGICWNAPSLANALKGDDYADLSENTLITMAPVGDLGRVNYSDWCFGFSIFKNCQSVEASKELLAFLYEGDWYDRYFDDCAPTVIPVFTDSDTKGVWTEETNAKVLNNVKECKTYPFGYSGKTLDGVKNGILVHNQWLLNAAVQRCMIDDMSVEDSMAQLQREMEEAIAAAR